MKLIRKIMITLVLIAAAICYYDNKLQLGTYFMLWAIFLRIDIKE